MDKILKRKRTATKDDKERSASVSGRSRSRTPTRRNSVDFEDLDPASIPEYDPSPPNPATKKTTTKNDQQPSQPEPPQGAGEKQKDIPNPFQPEPEGEPKKRLIDDPKVQATLNNPLGAFLFPQFVNTTGLCNPDLRLPEEEVLNFCAAFDKSMKLQKYQMQQAIELETKRVVKDERSKHTGRHFTTFTTQTGVRPPPLYASLPTLTNDHKIKCANSTFPGKGVFCGKKPPYVAAHLSEMNQAQAVLNLSRPEFKMYLQRSTSGEVYTMVSQSLQMGLTIEHIYHSLLLTYDNQISPQEASTKLLGFKAPKTMTFPKISSMIQTLASRSAVCFTDDTERLNVFNITACEALKRCLPTYSRNLTSELQIQLSHELGKAVSYIELTSTLYKHTEAIDQDVQQNGVAYNYNGDLSLYKKSTYIDKDKKPDFKGKQGATNTKLDTTTTYQKSASVKEVSSRYQKPADQPDQQQKYNSKQTNNNKPYHNRKQDNYNQGQGKQDYHIPYGNSDKKYCGACGQNTHKSSDGCKLLRDDQGRQIHQALTTGYCNTCFKRYDKKLYHADALCPGRPAMMEVYNKKLAYPAGLFRRTYQEWLDQQSNSSRA